VVIVRVIETAVALRILGIADGLPPIQHNHLQERLKERGAVYAITRFRTREISQTD